MGFRLKLDKFEKSENNQKVCVHKMKFRLKLEKMFEKRGNNKKICVPKIGSRLNLKKFVYLKCGAVVS